MPVETAKPALRTIGQYDLIEKIADGGMGSVYKGRHQVTGDIVAIKVVPPHMATNKILVKRLEQEYRSASNLNHSNIVRALDYGVEDKSPYLVMEFVDGESLGTKLEREGKLTEEEAIRIISQVANALHKAHKKGLVHRDVKPDNILINTEGTAKLADLGLVKELETDLNLTRTGRGLGTPHFMSPEQFRNAKNADVRCDIYSLGATLYMMVTGELPFKSCGPLDAWMKKVHNEIAPARQLVPELSERIDWAIRRSMMSDPTQRPTTAREFVEDVTGKSVRRATTMLACELPKEDLWFMVYTDDDGITHTVKGSLQGIRRSLQEGLLGDAENIRVAQKKSGPFEPLRDRPEFRDLVVRVEDSTPSTVVRKGVQTLSMRASDEPRTHHGDSKRPLSDEPRTHHGDSKRPLGEEPRTHHGSSTPPSLKNTPVPRSGPQQTPLPSNQRLPQAPSADSIPKIGLQPSISVPLPPSKTSSNDNEWIKWVALIAVAFGAGIGGYYLMPFLSTIR